MMMCFPNCSTVIWCAPRFMVATHRSAVAAPGLVASTPRCSKACGWCSRACRWCSQVLPGLWKVLPDKSLALLCTSRWAWRPLHQSSILWDLTTLGFWSDYSQTHSEAPRDQNTICWCATILDHALQVCTSMATNLAQAWCVHASPDQLSHSLQAISEFTWSQTPIESSNILYHHLQGHNYHLHAYLQSYSNISSMWIAQFTWFQPPHTSSSSLNHGLHPSASPNLLNYSLQMHY